MHLIDPQAHTRRAFLRRSGQLAMAGSALPFALNLAAIGEAAAQAAGDDYKALVCVFLFGGNDYANTVITYDDTSYNAYSAIRGGGAGQTAGGVAIAKADLTPTLLTPTTPLADGRQYALHPSMTELATLFNTDAKAAVQLNVGPLVVPLTRAQYNSGNRKLYPVPPKLFSHNDQQSTWQSSSPEGSTVGWGGNLGDLMLGQNTNSLFTCMSVSGNAVFLSGDTALQYQVSTGGAVRINSVTGGNVYGSSTVKAAMAQMVQQARGHALENEYTKVTKRAVDAEGSVTSAIGSAFSAGTFPATGLGNQLAMVARLIRGRATLGAKRQVFFVSMGGFDLHDNLIANQPGLMKQLSDALAAFYRQTVALGVADKVTAFTASDFGRTLASNGDGSDHGWGGHHLIVGGAVKGKQIYGTPQVVSINNDSKLAGYEGHVGQGRLIPSTSVDQYGATLASWFGVPVGSLESILPNLRNFGGNVNGINYPKNIGFMT
ncbi:DUF1501 domain-containing protein [Variovorax sp. JS1663]|uniref:DUF1501 domain-containing protein n=1 Tax=Variovorax sp. JS1663 TaxID=1851577 RepID=UPI000B345472|nr:DUF1501 domain-containing protein [Variovorax sp. JS1663]OUM03865.1 Tat pathway signal protein [Variovorax sp. JS1663]